MSEKNEYNKAYDEGYNSGKTDDAMGNISHNLSNVTLPGEDQKKNDSYNKGYEDGGSDKYDDSNSHYSGGTSESSGK